MDACVTQIWIGMFTHAYVITALLSHGCYCKFSTVEGSGEHCQT